ncbi:FtsX-like permease family protein, partial [bacterium]|nr:FtsX-like permease family protein [bacterium]
VAVVGSIGLIGTMSLNVVERGREVGVMRSIGAASMDVVGIFLVEGILIGLVSWFAALPFSYPAARMFSGTVGNSLFSFPLEYQYSIQGVWLWFIIVALLSTLASIWPALRASRISVRESLSYE